jgi:hypothetical protein
LGLWSLNKEIALHLINYDQLAKNQSSFMSEAILLNTFFWAAIVLMAIATSGVGYLTYLEWQDRRRRGGKS